MNEELNSIVKQLNNLALKQTGLNPKEKTVARALKVFVDSYGGTAPGSSMWGTISGSIENQADLIDKINAMIDDELANFAHLDYEIVNALPTIGEPGKRYLVKHATDDRYEEYMYVNGQWYDIGASGDVNLDNYYNKTETDTLLTGKADVSDLPTKTSDLTNDSLFVDKDTDQLTNYTKTTALNNALNLKADKTTTYTKDEVNTKLDLKADTDDIPTKTSDLTNDSGFITKAVNNLENYTKTTDLNTALGLKANATDVPTKTSDLTNDSGYIDANVNNLTNYTKTADLNTALNLKADKSTTYTKTEVDTKLDTKVDKTSVKSAKSSTSTDVYNAPYINDRLDEKLDVYPVEKNFNDYNDLLQLYNDVYNNQDKRCIGSFGTLQNNNLKTLLGDPEIGNYAGGTFEFVNGILSEGLIRIVAYSPQGTIIKVGYITKLNATARWTGWNSNNFFIGNITAQSGTLQPSEWRKLGSTNAVIDIPQSGEYEVMLTVPLSTDTTNVNIATVCLELDSNRVMDKQYWQTAPLYGGLTSAIQVHSFHVLTEGEHTFNAYCFSNTSFRVDGTPTVYIKRIK